MASSSSSSATPSGASSFEARVQNVKISKALINELIMDYFVREGFPQSASLFSTEANLHAGDDGTAIQERVEIRNCIHIGDIQKAIELIIALDPQIIEKDPALHFSLLRLQMVELVRPAMANPEKNLPAALEFAEKELAPRAVTNPKFLRDLEETMALTIFTPSNVPASLSHLLQPELRQSVAQRVNDAILESMVVDPRGRLYELIKIRQWAENRARQAKKDIPDRLHIGLESVKPDDGDSIMQMSSSSQTDGLNLMVS